MNDRNMTTVGGIERHSIPQTNLLDTDPVLQACPFCGSDAGYRGPVPVRGFGHALRAECSNTSCGIATPFHHRSRRQAAEAWNRRSQGTKAAG